MRRPIPLERPPRPHRLRSAGASVVAGVLACVASLACAVGPERLPELDRRFYENLSSEEDRAAFLDLRPGDRQAFLERKGLWKAWASLTAEERSGVESGNVGVGFQQFAAHMAFGRPADVRVVEAGTRTVSYETFIRCTSGPKTGQYVRQTRECDGTSSELRLAVEDGLVTEIRFLD